jgi:predicted TIM-barrel fold metal-dependent hydrolase
MVIDGYTHCGQDKFLPVEAVLACMRSAGVAKAVLCQHLGQTDNHYITSCVRHDPSTFAGVALLDSARSDWAVALAELVDESVLRGVRMTADMALGNREFAYSALDLGLNLVLYAPDGIDDVVDLVLRAPSHATSGHLIITHLGSPTFDDEHLTRGRRLLDCAAADRTMVTLSGLTMYTPYPHAAARSFVRDIVSTFGSDRVMWGSNYPVVGDDANYARDLGLLLENAWGLPDEAIPDIAGGNAEAVWFT